MSSFDSIDDDFSRLKELMKQTSDNLKQMSEIQKQWRFQFGELEVYSEFVKELDNTIRGWVSSHC